MDEGTFLDSACLDPDCAEPTTMAFDLEAEIRFWDDVFQKGGREGIVIYLWKDKCRV